MHTGSARRNLIRGPQDGHASRGGISLVVTLLLVGGMPVSDRASAALPVASADEANPAAKPSAKAAAPLSTVRAGAAAESTGPAMGAAANWPQFRGPGGNGVGDAGSADIEPATAAGARRVPPTHWSATEPRNIAWHCEVPGRGWSSPIVWQDKVFLTTAVIHQGSEGEAPKGLYFFGERYTPPDVEYDWKVLCFGLADGKLLWERTAHSGKPTHALHKKNTYATETPATDGERLYVCFGNVGLYCYDFSGALLWSRPIEPQPTRLSWGPASSPVVQGGRVYLCYDNEANSYLMAIDAASGAELWRTPRDEKSNWSTPFVWQHDRRSEIVTAGTGKTRSYSLDGELLWELRGMSAITIGTPYARHGLLYVSSGYTLDRSKPIYAIRPGAAGDITLPEGETSSAAIAWRQPKAAPYNPTTLVYGDLLYVLLDRGLVACYDAHSGEPRYEQQRLPEGRAFTASPWAYGGNIYFLNEDGVTFVVPAGREFKLSHTNTLADDEMTMATPAIAGDRLLIRGLQRLYCIGAGGH